ncbi:MAG: bifunctional diaminohydroxyphosphoribosylaminopyrimidine deaminase/5-amino-6-(5-phosphoribosylamino)uracil reductase RibD [Ferrimicrobium sp.]|jgi:diaminohydroxyphosphoribosylaminopyrimidine deaminase/5-amino-6-(5-phosphoribosylamino)uracil reductase|uniref:Riboflavin biosynthesis protein RibD n=1 Tax=Ferrimicrobium acidiphilum TaxID=121039 RepID=A0ABV3XZH8_9ACTN|nr:bifunctional diaminohydroxyphosphoribosylaminopyrimidine deaminase/5-amino-6-(5-phosphoribosylamino)uracil reductase RibD [Ferrimicrobium sp.]MCL5974216.1 bifunctional diaminohydroxyphosphoribosylaminopyrimidine deaminase/5-amino-6-(5-phosphoribosylamino)uracil reductase RibD [Actinomycetota bacterium]
MIDAELMELALALSRSAREGAPPNPWVGAVVVDDDGVAGQGWTHPSGGPHAEVVALREAGDRARGATMYVTLEPCAHQGRTPPCVAAIEAAGIRRVVASIRDPDERVAGRGLQALRDRGLEVEVGLGAHGVIEELLPYLWQRSTHRPWVRAKVAMTLDARVADRTGVSKWITSAPARERAHRLRSQAQAIVVGARTMEIDRPLLSARPGGVVSERQPERWVFARHPLNYCTPGVSITSESPSRFLDRLGTEGVLEILVEGGPTLLGSFLADDLVDDLHVHLAPIILGDPEATPAFRLPQPGLLSEALRLTHVATQTLGVDVELSLRSASALARQAAFEVELVKD